MILNINPFNQASIDEAIKQLEAYEKSLPDKCTRLAVAAAELGAQTATETYANAEFDSTHKNFSVSAEERGVGKASVVASGPDVGFLEFGFGVTQPGWSGKVPYPPHGSLSEVWPQVGPRPYWNYNGHISSGSPPAEGMLTAMRAMGAQVGDLAKEVFNSD